MSSTGSLLAIVSLVASCAEPHLSSTSLLTDQEPAKIQGQGEPAVEPGTPSLEASQVQPEPLSAQSHQAAAGGQSSHAEGHSAGTLLLWALSSMKSSKAMPLPMLCCACLYVGVREKATPLLGMKCCCAGGKSERQVQQYTVSLSGEQVADGDEPFPSRGLGHHESAASSAAPLSSSAAPAPPEGAEASEQQQPAHASAHELGFSHEALSLDFKHGDPAAALRSSLDVPSSPSTPSSNPFAALVFHKSPRAAAQLPPASSALSTDLNPLEPDQDASSAARLDNPAAADSHVIHSSSAESRHAPLAPSDISAPQQECAEGSAAGKEGIAGIGNAQGSSGAAPALLKAKPPVSVFAGDGPCAQPAEATLSLWWRLVISAQNATLLLSSGYLLICSILVSPMQFKDVSTARCCTHMIACIQTASRDQTHELLTVDVTCDHDCAESAPEGSRDGFPPKGTLQRTAPEEGHEEDGQVASTGCKQS